MFYYTEKLSKALPLTLVESQKFHQSVFFVSIQNDEGDEIVLHVVK